MTAISPTLRALHWFWILAIWLVLGLIDATQTVFSMRSEGMHHAWGHLFLKLLFAYLPWALATPVVLRLSRKYPPPQFRPFFTWPVHMGACLIIALVYSAWNAGLDWVLNPWNPSSPPDPFLSLWFDDFYNSILAAIVLYTSIVAIGHVIESRQRIARHQTESARLSEQLTKAQLNALRHQIEPHFLFNTLNAVAGLVRERRNDAAVNMIAALSDFLRRLLQDPNKQEVTLEQELDFAQRYLDIEKIRFADRLRVSVDVPKELLPARIPGLILQPMVENAVKHGISKRAQGGLLQIAARRSDRFLTVSVGNDGPQLPADWQENQPGIGISNTRSRLRTIYGDQFQFNISNRQQGGVEASLSVPLKV